MSVQIKNLNGITTAELQDEIAAGGKFVMYQYCVSILILTFKRPSSIYFIRSNENALTSGLKYSFISLLFGWWGIPWGPIYTIGSFITNFKGGKDVTDGVVDALMAHQPIATVLPEAE